MKKSFLLVLFFLVLTLSSCLEAEVDIDLKGDGAGQIRMKVLAIDKSLNSMIDLLESDLGKSESYKNSDITRNSESDGRISLNIRKKFNRVNEVDKTFQFTSKKDSCEFQMIIPRENQQIVRKVTVNMPGEIMESNVKSFSGNSLVWNRTASSGNKLFVKSKTAEKNTVLILILVMTVVGLGVFTAILIIKMRGKLREVSESSAFCSECGSKAGKDDFFCQNCGQKLS